MKSMMLSLLLLAPLAAAAQQINAYRYWYDDNAASAVTTTVAATDVLALNTGLPTGTMAPGYHRVSLQVRDDDGTWSVPHTTVFVRTSGLVDSYRYWLNDDPATIVTASIGPNTHFNLVDDLSASPLERSFNLVTFQFRESDGHYSVPYTQAFVRSTGAVDGYEWWIDDAIEDRTASTIGPGALVDLIADLPVPAEYGDHVFTIRFSSVNGTWSVPLSSTYSYDVGIEELPGITDLLLFPNPATEELGLRLNTDASRTLHLQLLDISGALVRDLPAWSVNGTAFQSWYIGDLAPGTYQLRMVDGDHAGVLRFVKM